MLKVRINKKAGPASIIVDFDRIIEAKEQQSSFL